jgi:hypothetical protein
VWQSTNPPRASLGGDICGCWVGRSKGDGSLLIFTTVAVGAAEVELYTGTAAAAERGVSGICEPAAAIDWLLGAACRRGGVDTIKLGVAVMLGVLEMLELELELEEALI